jgi:DNA-binding transcriptional ArsR family regulator
MVELASERLDTVFHAIAHPTRRAIVRSLERGPRSVTELAADFPHSLAAVSKHLHVLEEARLVSRTWHGTTAECRLEPGALREADQWLAHYRAYWDGALTRLATLVEPERPRKGR